LAARFACLALNFAILCPPVQVVRERFVKQTEQNSSLIRSIRASRIAKANAAISRMLAAVVAYSIRAQMRPKHFTREVAEPRSVVNKLNLTFAESVSGACFSFVFRLNF
jgi:hypothetical protein